MTTIVLHQPTAVAVTKALMAGPMTMYAMVERWDGDQVHAVVRLLRSAGLITHDPMVRTGPVPLVWVGSPGASGWFWMDGVEYDAEQTQDDVSIVDEDGKVVLSVDLLEPVPDVTC